MFRKMMGFNGEPLCIIQWQSNGEEQTKTVCYTPDEKKWALDRFNTLGDFYNSYDACKVKYIDGIEEWYPRVVIEDAS